MAPKAKAKSATTAPAKTKSKGDEDTLIMELPAGTVTIKLRPDLAPQHVARIKELARELASVKASAGLFPDLEQQCVEYARHRDR